MAKIKNPEEVMLDMTKKADESKLQKVLNELSRTNRYFTVRFLKKSGEEREINAITRKPDAIKGTGTTDMSFKAKRQKFNMYGCYELQLTRNEKEMIAEMKLSPKQVKCFKSFYIANIISLNAFGKVYKVVNNDWHIDEKAAKAFEAKVK